jgi:hypothetical protein
VSDNDAILEKLLSAPGLYVGSGSDPDSGHPDDRWVARIDVRVLPNRSAVSLDYEARSPEHPRQHTEHTVLGRSKTGLIMVMAHSHADTVTVLTEVEPGRFVDTMDTSPFPIEIHLEVPESGTLVHEWWFGPPGQTAVRHDVAHLELLDGPAVS